MTGYDSHLNTTWRHTSSRKYMYPNSLGLNLYRSSTYRSPGPCTFKDLPVRDEELF